MASKRLGFGFDPKAWLSNPAVRAASPAARGVLVDLGCRAAVARQPVPVVAASLRDPPTAAHVARSMNCSPEELRELVGELDRLGLLESRRAGSARPAQGVKR